MPFVRGYDSLDPAGGRFGPGWRLVGRDVGLQIGVPATGRESSGVYEPLRDGTRVYLTLPSGERVGFTFRPVEETIPNQSVRLKYYRPAWVAVLAEILLDEILEAAWSDGERDAAQLLVSRLERLVPGREGAA